MHRRLYSTTPPSGAPCRQILLKVQGVGVFPLAARGGIPAVHPFAPQLSARLAAVRCREGREAGRAGKGRTFRCREVGEEETTCMWPVPGVGTVRQVRRARFVAGHDVGGGGRPPGLQAAH